MTAEPAIRMKSARLWRGAALATGFVGRRYRYPGQRVFSVAAHVMRRFPPPGELVYEDPDGYVRHADLRDQMESLVFVGRHRLAKSVMASLRPGDWALDIGANIGSVAGQMCRAVGPTGLVWAFEPIPRNIARLTGLAEANSLAQLEVFGCALSSRKGTAAISLAPEGFSYASSFTASWISDGRLDVATERLDDLTHRIDDPKPLRLVKLDVEGLEREVLEGACGGPWRGSRS